MIGSTCRYVSEQDALAHVAGYCLINDISEREFQIERAGTWDKGKGCDTFGPTGPWLVTRDEVKDPQNLDMYLDVNGKRMQTGNTSTMIFTVAQIIEHLSSLMTLHPGDVIITGTNVVVRTYIIHTTYSFTYCFTKHPSLSLVVGGIWIMSSL